MQQLSFVNSVQSMKNINITENLYAFRWGRDEFCTYVIVLLAVKYDNFAMCHGAHGVKFNENERARYER